MYYKYDSHKLTHSTGESPRENCVIPNDQQCSLANVTKTLDGPRTAGRLKHKCLEGRGQTTVPTIKSYGLNTDLRHNN